MSIMLAQARQRFGQVPVAYFWCNSPEFFSSSAGPSGLAFFAFPSQLPGMLSEIAN
jgi:hypothetical protein